MKILLFVAIFMPALAGSAKAETNCENLSNVERSYCFTDYGEFLERRMVATYQSADQELKRVNDKMEGVLTKHLMSQLQPSQIAFEAYRKAQCSLEAARVLGGSGTGIFEQLCRNELTQQRIKYLKSLSSSQGDT